MTKVRNDETHRSPEVKLRGFNTVRDIRDGIAYYYFQALYDTLADKKLSDNKFIIQLLSGVNYVLDDHFSIGLTIHYVKYSKFESKPTEYKPLRIHEATWRSIGLLLQLLIYNQRESLMLNDSNP